MILVVSSLLSCSSYGVFCTACSSISATLCWSFSIASTSFITWLSTGSSSFYSKPITEKSAPVTASLTSIYSARSCSFSCWICTLSSAKFAWKSYFSYCATSHSSMTSSFDFFRAFVACYFSSWTWWRKDSVKSAFLHSWVGSSPNCAPFDGGGAGDTAQLE